MKHFLALALTGILITTGVSLSANPTDTNVAPATELSTKKMINAHFPGGKKALRNYFQERLVYPKNAERERREGRLLLRLDINESGRVTNFHLNNKLDEQLYDQLTEIFTTMPNFVPAVGENGQYLKSRVFLQLDFYLIT